jgi:branched-chain amino acid transport system permease protein
LNRFVILTVDGLSQGAAYAAFALALVLIWRATRVVNFAQGAMAVAAAYIAYSVTAITHQFWIGFVAALVSGVLIGVIIERGVMRFVSHTAPLNAVIVALGISLFIEAFLGYLYGTDELAPGNPFSHNFRFIGGNNGFALPSNFDVFVYIAVAVLVGALVLLFGRTKLGLRLRASAFAPEVSRLLGVNVAGMRTVGWALAAGAGALAAMVSPAIQLGLTPTAMDGVFVTAFTAAVLGGLDSPLGAVIGGLAIGVILSYVTGYWNAAATPVATLILLLVVLLLRPNGIFSGAKARHV